MNILLGIGGARERTRTLDPFLTQGAGLTLPQYSRPPGSLQGEEVAGTTGELFASPPLDKAASRELMHEAAKSLRLIESGDTTIEAASIMTAGRNRPTALHISTFSSDMTNPGNLKEFADTAQRYPDVNHLYFASFGNGGTSPLSWKNGERYYASMTGRYTWEINGMTVALPSIINLKRALDAEGLDVTRIMGSDSAGGNYEAALGVAMERGQLTHAHFSERSGFVGLSVARIVLGMLAVEKGLHESLNRRLSTDPDRLQQSDIEEASEILAIYKDLPERRHLDAHRGGLLRKAGSMVTSMQSLRRGPRPGWNPLLSDTDALHANQPGAHITYVLADHDPLYIDPQICDTAACSFMMNLRASEAFVRAIIVPGTHGYNTHYPALYHALKRDTLSK